MSVVIACKFNNGVIVASDRQVTRGYYEKLEDKVTKQIKIEGKNITIGSVGSLRELQKMKLIANKLFRDINDLNEDECIKLTNNITRVYRDFEFIEPTQIIKELNNVYLLTDPYNINLMTNDLSIMSDFDYYAIGCGDDLALGYLNVEFKDKDPNDMTSEEIIKILTEAIKTSCKDSTGIDDNVDISIMYKHANDLISDNSYEVIDKCEYDILEKSKPKSECNHKCDECLHNIRFVYSKKHKTIQMISN